MEIARIAPAVGSTPANAPVEIARIGLVPVAWIAAHAKASPANVLTKIAPPGPNAPPTGARTLNLFGPLHK